MSRATRSAETRLGELFVRLRASPRDSWTPREAYELACALVASGNTFCARRSLQLLERGEIDIRAAIRRVRAALAARVRQASPPMSRAVRASPAGPSASSS